MTVSTSEIISSTRISSVYRALTSTEPHRTGPDRWRAPATWRGGDGWSVSLDDSRGVWRDFATGDGGGMLDFVQRIRRGTRQDALRWLADYAGVPLDDRPLSAEDRQRWAVERAAAAHIRAEAAYFADAASIMAEGALEELSATDSERYNLTMFLAALQTSPEAEYRDWHKRDPIWAAALVNAGRDRERRVVHMLLAFIMQEGTDADAA